MNKGISKKVIFSSFLFINFIQQVRSADFHNLHKDYNKEEISIDLQRLCFNAGATFIKDKVIKLDSNLKELHLQNFPSVNYDLLSINTGSISNTKKINIDNSSKCFFVKPISYLLENLSLIDQIIKNNKN